jgi:hypothetical protein
VLAAAIVAVSMAAQAPQPQQAPVAAEGAQGGVPPGGPGGPPREFPKPTNLKVLPKDLTGKQVRDIMEGWSGALGVHCNACHTADPTQKGPNGRPRLNFADDSKHEKRTARLMFTMTQKINADYISAVDKEHEEHEHEGGAEHADHNVTCGTCHRGHQHPEAYIPPKEHDGPPAPAGEKPPLPRQ